MPQSEKTTWRNNYACWQDRFGHYTITAPDGREVYIQGEDADRLAEDIENAERAETEERGDAYPLRQNIYASYFE